MFIMEFVKKLLPRLDKDEVLNDISITKVELSGTVLPAYQAARLCFKPKGLKSNEVKELQKVFLRNLKISSYRRQENFIADIAECLPMLIQNLDYVEEECEKLFNADIIRDGLTAKKAMLIRSADQIAFMSRYMVDLLNLIYTLEAKAVSSELTSGFEGAEKVSRSVMQNIAAFGTLMSAYAVEPKSFEKSYISVPDVVINEETSDKVAGVYDKSELDPFDSSFLSNFVGSPIYHTRMLFAEWQANRYRNFDDTKKMLELRLTHLRMMYEDKSSPGLEKEIAYVQKRVDDLAYKMAKMES